MRMITTPHEGEHGCWKYHAFDESRSCGIWRCSKCNRSVIDVNMNRNIWTQKFEYCPHCGAKMDSEE